MTCKHTTDKIIGPSTARVEGPSTGTEVSRALQLSNDPARYARKKLTAHDITKIISEGPSQPPFTYAFPKSNGRSFQVEWFCKILPDKSMTQHRNWISYSMSTNSAFCLPCLIFGGPQASPTWVYEGWSNWRCGVRDIDRHELSKEHRYSEIA